MYMYTYNYSCHHYYYHRYHYYYDAFRSGGRLRRARSEGGAEARPLGIQYG